MLFGDCYSIRVLGQLDLDWSDWFDGLSMSQAPDGVTIITGPLRDQAALYGLLMKVRDLGLPLLSVNRVECG